MSTSRDALKRRRKQHRLGGHIEPERDENVAGEADKAERWQGFIFKVAIIVLATLWIYSPAYHGD